MSTIISLNSDTLYGLNLAPAIQAIAPFILNISAELDPQIQFDVKLPQDPDDPRELSEIPEVRLWFIRLDTVYPWLPFWLNWKDGELGRYTAMLVPHQFHPTAGIQYNPEALEIFLMHKLFLINDWLKQHHLNGQEKLKGMAKLLGYELEDGLFTIL